jgi:hypothetical protein
MLSNVSDPRSTTGGPAPRLSRGRWLRAAAAFATTAGGLTAAWTALVHCNQASTTLTYTPITGVEISSQSLVLGHGCNDDPNDPNAVYRYSAVISYVYEGGVPLGFPDQQYASVFECFANGYFENLPVSDGGNQSFAITVAAWNFAGFPAALGPCTSEPDGSAASNLCPAEQVSAVLDGGGVPPQWTTTCTAYLQPQLPAVAACGPLVPFDSRSAASDTGTSDASPAPDGAVEAGAVVSDAAGE